MKLIAVQLCLLVSFLPGVAWGEPIHLFFRDRVKSADVIVEGTIVEQADINANAKWSKDVYRKLSTFKVSRVHKGRVPAGGDIKVLSHYSLIRDTCRLEKGTHYLLMLKGTGEGFIDINHGQGTYEVVDLGAGRRAVVSSGSLGPEIPLLEQFRSDLAWALEPSGPTTSQPALAADKAQDIAENALFDAGIDVTEYRAGKPELLTADHDVMGVAYKDEPVWFFQWELSAPAEQDSRPADRLVYCYVNARTGNAYYGPNRPKARLSAQDICRVFLRMYGPCRQDFEKAGRRATIRFLTEEEFTRLAPRLKRLFLSPKASYPEGSCFLRAEFPPAAKVPPVILVLDPEWKIDFAGVVQDETPPASN